jgi:ATP-dependent Clp protease ATP-binding subunit ClpA
MFERFTDRARKVMALANQEAQRFLHDYITPEHILLGLVKEGSGTGANVLKNLGVELTKARLEVEIRLKTGTESVGQGKLLASDQAKQVVIGAIEEARGLNHNYVGTEHLLLGLLRQGESAAAQVLADMGVTLESARAEVQLLLGAADRPALEKAGPRRQGGISGTTGGGSRHARPLSDRARKVLAFANQEAQRFNHEHVGTEHILLGLVKEGSGIGANTLKNLNVDLRLVRLEVEKLIRPGVDEVLAGKLPLTPRAKKVLEYAEAESRDLRHNYVGTEHLLLGLLKERYGVASQVLTNLGLELEAVRSEVRSMLGAGATAERPEPREVQHNRIADCPLCRTLEAVEGSLFPG